MFLLHVIPIAAASGITAGFGIAVGGGLGAVGAGVGIGMMFGKVIESVTRQPEMRDEITSIQWLGFALTEAIFFYGLVAGFISSCSSRWPPFRICPSRPRAARS